MSTVERCVDLERAWDDGLDDLPWHIIDPRRPKYGICGQLRKSSISVPTREVPSERLCGACKAIRGYA